eukprot:gnl/TRDRNA2_/TRDRNA2_182632_c0_seq1.p1 gnl/TRDRNA2_/TRDRNA2_182632_c0~~gnl/TRDRNA2_/TRDRNA2_182632_c0_seq1.p1  ORF type:complete len:590 (+),score=129.00 gnl/TRDRNA2_/TRDRNA2_182632_c0_seq1:95-1864(+)
MINRLQCFAVTKITLALVVCGALPQLSAGHDFLHLDSSRVGSGDSISVNAVRKSLLEEIQEGVGHRTAGSRVAHLEDALKTMFWALPKNGNNKLGHATVKYALHRYFVDNHGWFFQGLEPAGQAWNASSPSQILKNRVPEYIERLFEEYLGGQGFGLHELAVMAATLEHLVKDESLARLSNVYKAHGLTIDGHALEPAEVDKILDTYMMAYVLGEDIAKLTSEELQSRRVEIEEVYPGWQATQEFVRDVTRNHTSGEQISFDHVSKVVSVVGEKFGRFQDAECLKMKNALLELGDQGTGRVSLSSFYNLGLQGGEQGWQFDQESAEYLRELGALDESEPSQPRVLVSNYINSHTNCLASSSFYSVCCINECEAILGYLEREIAAPEATPARVGELVSALPSSTVAAPRNLSTELYERLDEIATVGGHGVVPLHGRLFAQWLHHVYPRECPYPHLSGTTNPRTADEWMEETGRDAMTSTEEMQRYVQMMEKNSTLPAAEMSSASSTEGYAAAQADPALPAIQWSIDEELLVTRPAPPTPTVRSERASVLRVVVLVALLGSFAAMLVSSATSLSAGAVGKHSEFDKQCKLV